MIKILELATVILLVHSSQPNYQERGIDYSPTDHICMGGQRDILELVITFGSGVNRNFQSPNQVCCDDQRYGGEKQISPMTGWGYSDDGTKFKQWVKWD